MTDKPEAATKPPLPFAFRLRSSKLFITITVGLALFTDSFVYGLIVPVAPFRIAELGYKNVASKTGILVAAYAIGLTISSIPVGVLAELFRARQLPLFFGILFMGATLVMFMESHSYGLMVASRVLQGVAGTIVWTLGLALLTDTIDEAQIGHTLGYVMFGFTSGALVGPILGGILYEHLGFRSPFVCALILLLFDALLRLVIIERHTSQHILASLHDKEANITKATDDLKTQDKQKFKQTFRAVGQFCKNRSVLSVLTISLIFGIAIGGVLDGGLTLRMHETYGLSAGKAGIIFIAVVFPAFATSPIVGWASDKYGPRWPMLACLIATLPCLGLLMLRTNLPLYVFFLVLVGCAQSPIMAPLISELCLSIKRIPGLGYGHIYAGLNLAYSIGTLVGPLLSGFVLEAQGIFPGFRTMLAIIMGLFGVCIPLVWLFFSNTPIALVEPLVKPVEKQEAHDRQARGSAEMQQVAS